MKSSSDQIWALPTGGRSASRCSSIQADRLIGSMSFLLGAAGHSPDLDQQMWVWELVDGDGRARRTGVGGEELGVDVVVASEVVHVDEEGRHFDDVGERRTDRLEHGRQV